MEYQIQELLYMYSKGLKKILQGHMKKVILYGSYARGDFRVNSDVDIMVLVDISEDEIREYIPFVADYTFEVEMEYGIRFSPVIENENHFIHWRDYLPYFRNVSEEGVVIDG